MVYIGSCDIRMTSDQASCLCLSGSGPAKAVGAARSSSEADQGPVHVTQSTQQADISTSLIQDFIPHWLASRQMGTVPFSSRSALRHPPLLSSAYVWQTVCWDCSIRAALLSICASRYAQHATSMIAPVLGQCLDLMRGSRDPSNPRTDTNQMIPMYWAGKSQELAAGAAICTKQLAATCCQ